MSLGKSIAVGTRKTMETMSRQAGNLMIVVCLVYLSLETIVGTLLESKRILVWAGVDVVM